MKFPSLPRPGRKAKDDVRDIINYLRASRVINVVGGKLKMSPNGTTIEVKPGGPSTPGARAAAPTGAFYKIYTVVSGDATNGDIMLQGGQVAAGSGNATIADFLLYDISATTWAGTAGQMLQLTVNGDGSSEDGILMPTFDLTSTTGPAAVASIAANTLPIVGTLAGVCRISLGTFGTESFNPALPGNINVSFCFGGFTITRF